MTSPETLAGSDTGPDTGLDIDAADPSVFPYPPGRPGQPADAAAIRHLYQSYLGRAIGEESLARLIDAGRTLYEVEEMLRTSHEYLIRCEVRHSWFRSEYDRTNLVLAPARLLFCPIAKVANTSIKYWFVKLTDPDAPRPADVHRHIDSGNSSLQAKQFSFDAVYRALAHDGWTRVAILRDPIDRVISAYWDKFVITRKVPDTLFHTGPAYRMIYETPHVSEGIIHQGISFRQFCHFLARTGLDQTDPHWMPQHRYLENYAWDRLFDIDRISDFEDYVRGRLAPELRDIPLGMINNAPRADQGHEVETLTDSLPFTMDGRRKPPNEAFLTEDLRRFLESYYALDRLLMDRVRTDAGRTAQATRSGPASEPISGTESRVAIPPDTLHNAP